MARAKRIDRDRAEARRRHRAAAAAETAGIDGTLLADEDAPEAMTDAPEDAGVAGVGRPAAARPGGRRTAANPVRARMGLRQAFLAAYRPVHLLQDLRALPRIVTHWSVWGPVLVAVVATALPFVLGSSNSIAQIGFSMFVAPGALAGVFVAGYFAPTAAYLAGLIVALASSVLFSVFAWALSQGALAESPTELTPDLVATSVVQAFTLGPLYGIFLGALAAWYKRFLQYTSPPRTPSRPAASTSRRRQANARPRTR